MPFAIQMCIIVAGLTAVGTRGNDRQGLLGNNPVDKVVGIIGAISNQMLERETLSQSRGLGDIMPLACAQAHAQWVAQGIDTDVDFGREATTRAPQRLADLTAACGWRSGCTWMGTRQRAVNDQVLRIWRIGKLVQQLCPYSLVTPPRKALVNAVPLPIRLWQQTPLRPTAHHPQHPIQEPAAFRLGAHIHSLTRSQEGQDFDPFVIL